MSDNYPNKKVIVERIKRIALITLSNGDMNLFDSEQVMLFRDALLELKKDPKVRVIVIRGSGNRAFSAGFDLKESGNVDVFLNTGQEFMGLLYNFPVPKIALVHGYAIGIGCLVTFACDFRYCTKDVVFSLPEIKYKFMFPTHGGMTITSKIVRKPSDAKFILCTGDKIKVPLAEKMGLIDQLFDTKEEMENAGMELARKLGSMDSTVMSSILTVFDKCASVGLAEGMSIENEALEVVQSRGKEKKDLLQKLKEKYLDESFF
ncbi:MAG: enoyl-CoA hydratase/isomerase family protein [Candidatus Helarchaeota archaeon]